MAKNSELEFKPNTNRYWLYLPLLISKTKPNTFVLFGIHPATHPTPTRRPPPPCRFFLSTPDAPDPDAEATPTVSLLPRRTSSLLPRRPLLFFLGGPLRLFLMASDQRPFFSMAGAALPWPTEIRPPWPGVELPHGHGCRDLPSMARVGLLHDRRCRTQDALAMAGVKLALLWPAVVAAANLRPPWPVSSFPAF
jgi:hypothetical protein